MIKSDSQLKVTKQQIERLQKSLSHESAITNPLLREASELETTELIDRLMHEVNEYECLRKGGIEAIKLEVPADFMLLPLKYRIAKHMTQEEFSKEVQVSLRAISRYEKDEYQNITGTNLKKILDKLRLKFEGIFHQA